MIRIQGTNKPEVEGKIFWIKEENTDIKYKIISVQDKEKGVVKKNEVKQNN